MLRDKREAFACQTKLPERIERHMIDYNRYKLWRKSQEIERGNHHIGEILIQVELF